MIAAGVPCIPGYHGHNQEPEFLKSEAEKIGFPVLLKAVKGGGGKGMRIARTPDQVFDQLASAKSEARNSFGDDAMLVEKYITVPRHIEVQVFADKHGNCVALGERDCSIQRRHQKILEESPAPGLAEDIRQDLWDKARKAALAVNYEGAGTVEFIFDNETGEFFFMEMNTRLQVEHPVTEMVTSEDLVRWQLLIAEGHPLPLTQAQIQERIAGLGHAIEARIYAENPDMYSPSIRINQEKSTDSGRDFIPDSGTLLHLRSPTQTATVRIDAGFVEGDEVSSFYDPMIAKLIVRAPDRGAALQKLGAALETYEVAGPKTNIAFLKRCCVSPAFVAGDVETGYIDKHREELFKFQPAEPEVLAQAALATLLQEQRSKQQGPRPSLEAASDNLVGFGAGYQSREIHLSEPSPSGRGEASTATVRIDQRGSNLYDVTVGETSYSNLVTALDATGKTLTTFFPHTRISTTSIRHPSTSDLTLFQQGRQYNLTLLPAPFLSKALGIKDTANSVLAPMPCKVLRVQVKAGDEVRKEQALVVIESMKMETTIRSPQNGRISRIVHGEGDICKAGTPLVEFEGANAHEEGEKA